LSIDSASETIFECSSQPAFADGNEIGSGEALVGRNKETLDASADAWAMRSFRGRMAAEYVGVDELSAMDSLVVFEYMIERIE
jgi:hypothetical protein